MYKILGTDLKEYGPASMDQVIQWINEGRADAQTRVLAEGSAEWKPLSALPEFAAAMAAKAPAPVPPIVVETPPATASVPSAAPGGPGAPPPPGGTPPPSSGATPPQQPGTPPIYSTPPPIAPPPSAYNSFDSKGMADRILARGVVIDPMRCIGRSWDLVMRHFWLLVGATFVINLLDGAVAIIHGALYGGLYLLFLKLIRGQRAEFGDCLAGFSEHFLQLFLAGLVAGLLTLVGYGLCIVPGIYLTIAWLFVIPLVIDKRLEFWPAIEVSLRVVQRNWFQFFLLGLLNVLVCMVGLLAFCIGIYVALPITIGAIAYAYEDVFGPEPAAPPRPL